MKIDLHCHSKYSDRPVLWVMKKLGCPESFTEPVALYHLQRRMGMDAVTITDHNVIDGCLEILHLPNTFTGCEYTTYFPQDGCKVHVLAYCFSEAQHRELNELRKNIFEFTAYLRAEGLPHACAHPLFGPNERLTPDHVEQLALLYKHWEINGDQAPIMNAALEHIARQMTPKQVELLENKHGFAADYPEPWKKVLIGGTDCHSSLHLGQTYTEAPGAATLPEFWSHMAAGRVRVHLETASPKSFARNVYSIAYQFYRNKLGIERHVNKDILLRFLNRSLQSTPALDETWRERFYFMLAKRRRTKDLGAANSLFNHARLEAERLIRDDPRLMAILHEGESNDANMDELWFEFVNEMANRMTLHFGAQVMDRVMSGRFFDLFNLIGSSAALYVLIAPYLASFSHYQFERKFTHEVLDRFLGDKTPDDFKHPVRVAHFTDTLTDVNGVSRTLQQQAHTAFALRKEYQVLACGKMPEGLPRNVSSFTGAGELEIPEYPELKLLMPPLLEMLDYCHAQGFTHIHLATPGPVGLAGLAIARILRLPVSGTYHTAFPEYAKALTDDAYVEDIAWKYMVWFYDQLDAVYVPSEATGRQLIERGIKSEKVRMYPRGIDVERFHPEKRSNILSERFGLDGDCVNLLYAGRVSREKNLHILEEAFQKLLAQGANVRLVVVGDGPYLEEMKQNLAGMPACFTGYLGGEDLPQVFASCDIFLFPSATDTFGNVVLEAQASGLAVIVTDEGGPQENLVPGETGFVVRAGDAQALCDAALDLSRHAVRRTAMGHAARRYMEQRGFSAAFETLYSMYTGEAESATAKTQRDWLRAYAPNAQQLAS